MYARAVAILSIVLHSSCIAVYRVRPQDIVPSSRIELKSLEFECELNDMILLPAPVATSSDSIYHLHKPDGEIIELDLHRPTVSNKTYDDQRILVKQVKDSIKVIKFLSQYKVISLNHGVLWNPEPSPDELALASLKENEFVIGPLGEEDHGNWVLSLYVPDLNGNIIEMFQVITIRLIESVPPYQRLTSLKAGDTFNLGFAYRVKNLESCEVIAPRSAFDRFFERNQMELDNCGFTVPNVTVQDEGIWKIIGVGRIEYETETFLKIEH